MSDLLAIGTEVDFHFPISGNIYRCKIAEQHPPKKAGDAERYRVIGDSLDCFTMREWLYVI